MLKKVLLGLFAAFLIVVGASLALWTQSPSFALSKIISAARNSDQNQIERYIDMTAFSSSLVEEALQMAYAKFPTAARYEPKNDKMKDYINKMVEAFVRDILNSKTPGFKFKELSTTAYLYLQWNLYWSFLTNDKQVRGEDTVDVQYNLAKLFQKDYLATFTFKKIGSEWVLYEIKNLRSL